MTTNKPTEKRGDVKYDGGKTPVFRGLASYFPRALQLVADVSAYGADVYDWKGWEQVENGFNRYFDAMYRHALAFSSGEQLDNDSGLPHLAHMAWNALAVLELYLREKGGREEIEDQIETTPWEKTPQVFTQEWRGGFRSVSAPFKQQEFLRYNLTGL